MTHCDFFHPTRSVLPGAIAVFDSGLGGLSILRHMVAKMPYERFLYVADNLWAPYGDRPFNEIEQRCIALVEQFEQLKVKAVVVACNTATVWAIKRLRDRYSLPIYGVEPAIKPALMSSRSRVVGVVATTRTLESRSFHQLCRRYNEDAEIITVACPKWVEMVETQKMGTAESLEHVSEILKPLLSMGVDTLVLGCTHFPMLIPEIRSIVGKDMDLIDPGAAVARHLANELNVEQVDREVQQTKQTRQTKGSVDFRLTTPNDHYFETMLSVWDTCLSSLIPDFNTRTLDT